MCGNTNIFKSQRFCADFFLLENNATLYKNHAFVNAKTLCRTFAFQLLQAVSDEKKAVRSFTDCLSAVRLQIPGL